MAADAVGSLQLTNLQQMLAIGKEAPRLSNYTARVRGVVTFPLDDLSWLYIQDGTNAGLVVYAGEHVDYPVGTLIEAEGTVGAGMWAPFLGNAQVRVIGEARLPEPKEADPLRLAAGEDFARYVKVRGYIRDMTAIPGRWMSLLLSGAGLNYYARIRVPSDFQLPRDWLDAEVEIRGICWTADAGGRAANFTIHTPSTNANYVTFLRPGSARFFDRPLQRIADLAQAPRDGAERVRIAGTVSLHSPAGQLYLEDETGAAAIHPITLLPMGSTTIQGLPHTDHVPLAVGDRIEVLGVPVASASLTEMVDAEYRRISAGTPVPSQRIDAAELTRKELTGHVVTVRARLLDRESRQVGQIFTETLTLEGGGGVFEASLASLHAMDLPFRRSDYLWITGVNARQTGEPGKLRSASLLLRSPEDVRPASPPAFWERPESRRALGIGGGGLLLGGAWTLYQRRQLARVRASDAAARRSEAATRTVNSFATSLLELNTEEEVCWDLAQNCIAQLGFLDCVIYLLDTERGVLVQKAALGPKNPTGRVLLNPLEIPVGIGIVGSVAATRVPERIGDTTRDSRYILDDDRRYSELAVPILVGNQVLGVIDSEHPERDFFTPEHEKLLCAIASLCANKLVRVRAVSELRTVNAGLEARVTQRTQELQSEVAARQQAEAELRVALTAERELNQLRSSFVSMVSHEFRTPLEVILSSSNILDRYLDRLPPEKRKTQLRAIRKSVHRMNDLVEDVLLLGKLDAGALTCNPVARDLAGPCRRAIDEIESAWGHEHAIQFQPECIDQEAMVDETLLHHILTNLLGNALKYSPVDASVDFTLSRSGPDARFVIRDRGCGIPLVDQPRLFTAFYRGGNVGNTPGSGLGLVTVKRCVDLHGGTVTCQSQPGEGTTFTVTLPVFDGTRVFARRPSEVIPPPAAADGIQPPLL